MAKAYGQVHLQSAKIKNQDNKCNILLAGNGREFPGKPTWHMHRIYFF